MEKIECPNCKSADVLSYCPTCGQKRVEGRLEFSDLAKNTISNVLYVEKRFLTTVKDLFLQPRHLIESFSYGARKRYAVPVQFFLFFLTLYLLSYSIFGMEILDSVEFSIKESGGGEASPEQLNTGDGIRETIEKYMNYLYFLSPPMMAIFIRLFFRKSINYAEALVLAFYVESINLFFALFFILAPPGEIVYGVKAGISIVWYAYLFGRYDSKWYVGIIKGVLILAFGMFSFSAVIGGLIVLLAMSKGLI